MDKSVFRYPALTGIVCLAAVASADDSFRIGGTRAAGMGGAGIALPIDVVQNQRLNPAMLGVGKLTKFGIQFPEIGIRTYGFGLSDLRDTLGNAKDAGVSNDSTIRFARQFGDRRTEAAADGTLGVVFSNISLSATGGADVTAIPNAPLRAFVASGRTDFQNAPVDSRLDAYGYGFYEWSVGAGVPVKTTAGKASVGARLNAVKSYFGHKVADQAAIASGTGVRNGAEFGGGEDTMSKSGFGADLGLLYAPKTLNNVYFGATVDNLIRPDVTFTRTLPNSDVLTEQFNPFVTVTTIGSGAVVNKKLLVAADLYDVFNRADRRELRLGGELSVGRLAAVRAGYNSTTGFTLGASVLGLNFAISGREPLLVSTRIRF